MSPKQNRRDTSAIHTHILCTIRPTLLNGDVLGVPKQPQSNKGNKPGTYVLAFSPCVFERSI
eukprot:897735-Amphidinium_carterae.2